MRNTTGMTTNIKTEYETDEFMYEAEVEVSMEPGDKGDYWTPGTADTYEATFIYTVTKRDENGNETHYRGKDEVDTLPKEILEAICKAAEVDAENIMPEILAGFAQDAAEAAYEARRDLDRQGF